MTHQPIPAAAKKLATALFMPTLELMDLYTCLINVGRKTTMIVTVSTLNLRMRSPSGSVPRQVINGISPATVSNTCARGPLICRKGATQTIDEHARTHE